MNAHILQKIKSSLQEEGTFLSFNDRNAGTSNASDKYRILNLIKDISFETTFNSSIHNNLNTSFSYVDHYSKDAKHFDYFQEYEVGATKHENRRLHETIESYVPNHIEEILDVGCGNAWVANSFCKKGVRVYSADIAEINVQKAIDKYPFENHYGLVLDVYNMPFKKESFECIISAEVIEHVSDPELYIDKLLKIAKKGGSIIITTPYDEDIPYHLCVHCNNPTPRHAHLHSFDEKKIMRILSSKNYESVEISTFSNKYLARLRTHVFLKHFPFKMWSIIDKITNKVISKPERLLVKITK